MSPYAPGTPARKAGAGLACGEANSISWEILQAKTSFFVSLPDYAAARAMRVLGAPIQGDPRVVSGESGAGLVNPIGPGTVVKHDARTDRLRVYIDADNRITAARCE